MAVLGMDGGSQAGAIERKSPHSHTMIDPGLRNEQRRMQLILNGVKQHKQAGFIEQLRDEQRQIRESA